MKWLGSPYNAQWYQSPPTCANCITLMIQRATPWAPTPLCTPKDPHRAIISLQFPPVITGARGGAAADAEPSPHELAAGYLRAELPGRKPRRTKETGTICPVAVCNLWSSRMKNDYKKLLLIISFSYSPAPATNFSLFHLWVWQLSARGPFLRLIPGAGSPWASLDARNSDIKKKRGGKENWGNKALTYPKSHLNRSRKALSTFLNISFVSILYYLQGIFFNSPF